MNLYLSVQDFFRAGVEFLSQPFGDSSSSNSDSCKIVSLLQQPILQFNPSSEKYKWNSRGKKTSMFEEDHKSLIKSISNH